MFKQRTLQVYSGLGSNPYPMIRLIGKWVYDAGFAPGDYIKVVVEKDQLLIRNTGINSHEVNAQLEGESEVKKKTLVKGIRNRKDFV